METLWFCIIDSSLVRMNRDTKPNALNFKFYWFILKYSFVISISSCLNFCRFEFEFCIHIWIEQDDIWIVLLSELCAVLRFFDVICIICMCTQFEMCMHARHRSPSSIIRNAPTADHAVSIAVNAMQCVRKKKTNLIEFFGLGRSQPHPYSIIKMLILQTLTNINKPHREWEKNTNFFCEWIFVPSDYY